MLKRNEGFMPQKQHSAPYLGGEWDLACEDWRRAPNTWTQLP